jgi:ribosomal protein S18 acetylase RimI-like enzyme
MSQSTQPGSDAAPAEFRPLLETDRRSTVEFLKRCPEENIYLLSRIAVDGVVNESSLAHGRFYGQFAGEQLRGVVFFGHRKGLVLAGEDDDFLRAAARVALGPEAGWIILVGPHVAADGFLSHYRWRGQSTHLNRLQDFYVLRPENLPHLAGTIRLAEAPDLDAVVEMSEQMLMEDFRLAPGSLSRDGIRDSMRRKIRDGRTWLSDEAGRPVFKVDVSAQYSGGSQIEGVFTRPDRRGQGIASRAIAALSAELLSTSAFVSLHVDQRNVPAKRAYEKAGFQAFSEFRLVLLDSR